MDGSERFCRTVLGNGLAGRFELGEPDIVFATSIPFWWAPSAGPGGRACANKNQKKNVGHSLERRHLGIVMVPYASSASSSRWVQRYPPAGRPAAFVIIRVGGNSKLC